jgi:soluble lytic murein transglycosylase
VTRWLEGAQNLPLDLWVARIPYRETRGYVQSVVPNWARSRYLVNGPSEIPTLALALPEQCRADLRPVSD